jgi:hypothetical protein
MIASEKLEADMKYRTAPTLVIAGILSATSAASAGQLSEDQARRAAALFVRDFGFGSEGGQVIRVPDGPLAEKSLDEIASHFEQILLVVRGSTGYCGIIKDPTWVLIWDSSAPKSWFGGNPVMINARTGKPLDCRS